MFGWAIKISIISILLIMIFHYSQFCFKQDVFAKQTVTNDDLKVQKYKNIISALSKQTPQVHQSDPKQTPQVHHSNGKQTPQVHHSDIDKNELVEDMSMDLMDYLNQKTTLPELINLDTVIIPEILQPEILHPKVLQPEVLHPDVLKPDSAQSEIIQLEITEITI